MYSYIGKEKSFSMKTPKAKPTASIFLLFTRISKTKQHRKEQNKTTRVRKTERKNSVSCETFG